MSFVSEAQKIAAEVEERNPHFSLVQISDMVFSLMFGNWTASESDRRNMRLIRAAIGVF